MEQLAASAQIVDGIDPEDALNLMTPRNPPGVVRVRGQVDSLHPWWSKSRAKSEEPDFYFGTLASLSSESSIDFKCRAYAAPDVGQLAVLEGALTYEGRSRHGLKMLLTGNCVGTFNIPDTIEAPLRPQDRAPKKSLINYLEDHDGSLHNLLVVGSDTGVSDIRSVLGDYAAEVQFETVPITNFKRVMDVIRERTCDAVVIVRGGDDDTLSFWNQGDCVRELLNCGKYFYTALGHAHRLTVADLFADQAFLTPSHCGQSLAMLVDEIDINKQMRQDLEIKTAEVEELQAARENDRIWHERKIASQMIEYSQYKGKVDAELAILMREKRLANLWVKMFAVTNLIFFGLLLAFIFDVGGVRSLLPHAR